jgi:hypothetical protein
MSDVTVLIAKHVELSLGICIEYVLSNLDVLQGDPISPLLLNTAPADLDKALHQQGRE